VGGMEKVLIFKSNIRFVAYAEQFSMFCANSGVAKKWWLRKL
jgi:hypothetical protein